MIPKVNEQEADLARDAAHKVVETHQRLVEFLRVGQTLAQIDAFVAKTLADLASRSAFLGYRVPRSPAFPSHACLSLNECIVHGTAGAVERPMRDGDVLKIDIGVVHKGWIGDAAWTYAFKHADDVSARLMACGRESLRRGVKTLRPGNTYLEWAKAVQSYVEGECGFHLVRGLGGHGYGRKLHSRPFVSNSVPLTRGEWADANTPCTAGTLVAVEPMIAVGTGETAQAESSRFGLEWPVYTADHSMSVHYEHDVLITDGEPEVLTGALERLPDIVG